MIIVAILFLALPAYAEQKNVKLLTGMTDIELLHTMNFMRASLGVHCDFCHVVNQGTGWDFASDEKQTKRMARHMIEMVQQINQQNFEGNPVVSCNTCHRGSTRPVALVSLPQIPPPFPTPIPPKPTNLPSRDEVVAKYTAAMGDVSRLKLARVVRGTREASDGKAAPFEAQMIDEKVHVVGQTPFGLTEQVVTASGGWMKTDKGVRKMGDDQIENFTELANAYEPLSPQTIPANAKVVNREKIGEHDTVVVAAQIDHHTRQRLFFDTSTGLLVRRQILRRRSIGEIPQQTDFDDYRDLSGTKFPFFVRVSLVDPWNSATRRYSEVVLGANIDEKVFTPPEGKPSS